MRKRTKLDSSTVQGDGSYIVLKPPAWGAAKQFITGGGEGDEQARGLALVEALLPLCVIDWNWTDDNDAPLPLPAQPGALNMAEVMWLVPHLTEFLTPTKN